MNSGMKIDVQEDLRIIPPRFNASRQPEQWQSFDVIFRAPRFDSTGRKISNARFEKVVHNDTIIHEDVELYGPTRSGAYDDEKARGPLMLQGDHGHVAYRNIWLQHAGSLPFFAMDTGTKDEKHRTAEQQVQMLKELGYAGIGYTGYKGLSEMLQELDKAGLRLFTIYIGVDLDHPERPYAPGLKDAFELLKGRNTIVWLFIESRKHTPSSADGDARAVEIIREIADMAADYRLLVALYPHYKFWIERVEDAVRVTEEVDRKNVVVTFNLYHWLRVEYDKNLKEVLRQAIPHLFIVTINGADKGSKNTQDLIQTLDQGSFDIAQFIKTLNQAGYNGPIGL